MQLLFKVEGQSLTNQRTEPHKSLISKNVSGVIKSNRCLHLSFHISVVYGIFSSHSQTLKSKQRMLKEDWEFFKQRKFIEEQVLLLNTITLWWIKTPNSACQNSLYDVFSPSYPTIKKSQLEITTSQTL